MKRILVPALLLGLVAAFLGFSEGLRMVKFSPGEAVELAAQYYAQETGRPPSDCLGVPAPDRPWGLAVTCGETTYVFGRTGRIYRLER